jgi:hypothetical protein
MFFKRPIQISVKIQNHLLFPGLPLDQSARFAWKLPKGATPRPSPRRRSGDKRSAARVQFPPMRRVSALGRRRRPSSAARLASQGWSRPSTGTSRALRHESRRQLHQRQRAARRRVAQRRSGPAHRLPLALVSRSECALCGRCCCRVGEVEVFAGEACPFTGLVASSCH